MNVQSHSMRDMNFITTREAADRLQLDVSTISRWVQLGKMTPAVRLANGHMLFDPADIDRLAIELHPQAAGE